MVAKNALGRLVEEREAEQAAIWGGERVGQQRMPARRRRRQRGEDLDDAASDVDSVASVTIDQSVRRTDESSKKAAKKKAKKAAPGYRLHTFVSPDTTKNDVREVFDQFDPKVDMRVTQKGNALNKSHFCVVTFRNKALALYAVKLLDGTNQRDTIGMNPMKLNMMLTRLQSKQVKRNRVKMQKRA